MMPKTDLDYVELYAANLRKDNSFFKQQKKLIESQMHSSSDLFRRKFGTGKKFKENARKYLRRIGLI
ncbi:hypothetical protein KY361_04050 [Candidatus Woesearchaeota archaeon]|nr:hypothetical protein [Candidatus Woesearchaeota archaeon]